MFAVEETTTAESVTTSNKPKQGLRDVQLDDDSASGLNADAQKELRSCQSVADELKTCLKLLASDAIKCMSEKTFMGFMKL